MNSSEFYVLARFILISHNLLVFFFVVSSFNSKSLACFESFAFGWRKKERTKNTNHLRTIKLNNLKQPNPLPIYVNYAQDIDNIMSEWAHSAKVNNKQQQNWIWNNTKQNQSKSNQTASKARMNFSHKTVCQWIYGIIMRVKCAWMYLSILN